MSIDVQTEMRLLRGRITDITGDPAEATAMVRLIFHALKGWDTTALVIHAGDEVSPFTLDRIDNILERLAGGEPLQYILGRARFYGMDLEVNPHTLIPRPETEELVGLIDKRYRSTPDLRVLDIGTGSGAIAIALSRLLPFSRVTAIDISPDAIATARRNAASLHADITLIPVDMYDYSPAPDSFDLIVSNPPYIAESEADDMEPRVLDHEPHTALFVPDSDPLKHYTRIAEIGLRSLTPGGTLWLEINPRYAADLRRMLERDGYSDVEILRDMARKDRFALATKI